MSVAFLLAALGVSNPADAIPAFSRKEGQNCGFCHTAYPKLNELGRSYKENGFRFQDVPGTNVWEDPSIPLSMVIELEAFIDHTNLPTGSSTTEGGGKVDEIEIMGAGTLTNRVSFFAELEFQDDVSPEFGPIWAQLNDLYGPQGAANVRAGQFELAFPFLSENRRVVRNKYLAFDRLAFLDTEFGAEVNGQLLADEEAGGFTHRYAMGVTRGGSGDFNLARGFGRYSVTWNDVNNAGLLVVGGQNVSDTDDKFDTVGIGLAGQTEWDQWTFTGAYFYEYQGSHSNSAGSGSQQFHNLMCEALFIPDDSWVLGGRLDWLIETERPRAKDWGLRASALARYNVVWNVWVGGEYRFEDGGTGSPVTGADTTHKGRLFTFVAF